MTPEEQQDAAYALAALEAGEFPIPRHLAGHRGWRTDNAEKFPLYSTPIAALAAAARALGLQPKWVVTDREVAVIARDTLWKDWHYTIVRVSHAEEGSTEESQWIGARDSAKTALDALSSALSPEGGQQS